MQVLFDLPTAQFNPDELSWLIILIAACTAALTMLATLPARSSATFTILAMAFVASSIVLVSTDNLLVFISLWEVTTVICWGIGKVGIRNFNSALGPLATSWLGSLGTVTMLLAFSLLIVQSRTLSMAALHTNNPEIIAVLILSATSFKSLGLLSMGWFPGRQQVFSATTALLAGAGIIVVGLFPYIRISRLVLASNSNWQSLVLWLSLGSALLFALAALKENDVQRVASHLAIGQFYMLIAAFTTATAETFLPAVFALVNYAAGIVGFFLTLGLLRDKAGIRLLGQTRNVAAHYPALAVLFALSAITLLGLPPLIGFTSKTLLAVSVVSSGGPLMLLWIAFWLAITLAIVRVFQLGFLFVSDEKTVLPLRLPFRPTSRFALLPAGIAIALIIWASLWQSSLLYWLQPVTRMLTGV
jgi:formate hydrogenlyase subunit 3/multisubunit Na+/H+ antiporter MnhD subunit